MKVYISCDMEGATGVVRWEQVSADKPEYEFGREMQAHDLLAVAQAAREAGADEVLVNDSHGRMINLDARRMPAGIRLVSGAGKALSMVEGVQGADVVFFVCYHAMAGTRNALLDHTMSGDAFEVTLDGRAVGELGFNAAVAGYFGVPVGLVTGDGAVCREAGGLFGEDLVCCAVKEGVGRYAGELLAPEDSVARLREATARALGSPQRWRRFEVGKPCTVELTVMNSGQADAAANIPGTVRESGRTLSFRASDAVEGYRWFRSALALAGTMAR